MISLFKFLGVAVAASLGFKLIPLSYGAEADLVSSVKFDPKCSGGATLHALRLTDCSSFPCKIKRGKEYRVDGDFSLAKDMSKLNVKCGTVYLGRQITFSDYGGCNSLNGSCPLTANTVYHSTNKFTVPYYVPPILYTVWCRLEDESGQQILCGSGSGTVV